MVDKNQIQPKMVDKTALPSESDVHSEPERTARVARVARMSRMSRVARMARMSRVARLFR